MENKNNVGCNIFPHENFACDDGRFIDATKIGTWIWNVQTGEFISNESCAEVVGYKLTEFDSLNIATWTDLIHPQDLEKINILLEAHFHKETEIYECEVRMLHKEGHWVWVLDRGSVIEWTEEGAPLMMHGTRLNVTYLKEISLKLEKTLERLFTLEAISCVGGWELCLLTNELWWSPATYKIHAVPEDYVPTLNKAVAFYTEDARKILQLAIDEAITKHSAWDLILPFVDFSGDLRTVRAAGGVKLDGSIPIALFGTIEDVTVKNRREKISTAIVEMQKLQIQNVNLPTIFKIFLEQILEVTDSEFGFIGEVFYDSEQFPYLKTHAISDIAWDESSKRLLQESVGEGLEFRNLKSLFGAVLLTGEVLISNSPSDDKRSGGLPSGHPPLRSFLCVPVKHANDLLGIIGVANRTGGYSEEIASDLTPLLIIYAEIIRREKTILKNKEIEMSLGEIDGNFRFATDGLGNVFFEMPIEQECVFVSDNFSRLIGGGEWGSTFSDFKSLIYSDDRPAFLAHIDSLINFNVDRFNCEFRISRFGCERWVSFYGTLFRNEMLSNSPRLIGVISDVDDRKRLEKSLQVKEQRFSAIVSAASEGIMLLDQHFNIIEFNSAAEEMFLVSAEDVLGGSIDRFLPSWTLIGSHREHMKNFATSHRATRRMKSLQDRQLSGRRSDGSLFPIEISITYAKSNNSFFYAAMMRDVSERVAIEDELKSLAVSLEERIEERTNELTIAHQQAEEANKAKSLFLANMSHEIRTPLNSVIGMAYLALKNNIDPKMKVLLERISLSGKHLLGLVNDILDFSKIEGNFLHIDRDSFSLEELLNDVESLMYEKAKEKKLSFVVSCDDFLPPLVYGDELRLRQVLLNLTSNAIKFTNSGSVLLELNCQVVAENRVFLSFVVADTGVGIDQGSQKNLFKSFYQADSSISRNYGGTGLGLAISHRLVELMGGELSVESQLNKGSRFSFAIVLDEAKDGISSSYSDESCVVSKIGGSRILVAEDHPFNQQLVRELLEDVGASVIVAADGLEAVSLARANKFDVILMDVQMPLMDGISATEELRKDAAFKSVPIIAITANVTHEDRDKCREAGMNDYISKPIKPALLYSVLERCLPKKNVTGEGCNFLENVVGLQVLNEHAIREMLGDDTRRQLKYFDLFLKAMKSGLPILRSAAIKGNISVLSEEAHRLKATARTVGAELLGQNLELLEDASRQLAEADWLSMVAEIESCSNMVLEMLRRRFPAGLSEVADIEVRNKSNGLKKEVSIVLLDDDSHVTSLIIDQFADLGIADIRVYSNSLAALEYFSGGGLSDWLFCDLRIPGMDGLSFLRNLGGVGYKGNVALISGLDFHTIKVSSMLARSFGLNVQGSIRKPTTTSALKDMLSLSGRVTKVQVNKKEEYDSLDESELHSGLNSNALHLYYQPKVSVDQMQVTGVECLARWQHPIRGVLPPSCFVEPMENYGLIDDMTKKIWSLALEQQQIWQKQGLSLKMSVNISMSSLSDLGFSEWLIRESIRYNIRPEMMIFEVTENRLASDYLKCIDALTCLRIHGFGLSIDDFGTGYSTMENLLNAPFTELKIDRSFVCLADTDSWARSIIEHSISLGNRFDLNVVAEGVETMDSIKLVNALGCHEVQGYFISKPLPANDFEKWLQSYGAHH